MVRPAQVSVEGVRSLAEGVTTTEGRVVATAVIVLTAFAGVATVPVLVRFVSQTLYRVLPDQAQTVVDSVVRYLPVEPVSAVTWAVRGGLLFGTAVGLLFIWGLVGVAVALLGLAGLSVPLLGQLVVTLVILLAAYIVISVLEDVFSEFAEHSERLTPHQRAIMLRVSHIAVFSVAVMGTLSLWGLDLSGLLVGAGFLGIVVGLAARQTLGSIIAGFVLMFSKPFAVGDWVEVAEHQGIVDTITVMNTRLRTPDGESVHIPNDSVSKQPIRNFSSQDRLRLRVEVGVDYDVSPDRAERIACEAMEEVDQVLDSPGPEVIPTGFGDSAVVLELRFWIPNPTPRGKWSATTGVIHAVKRRFEDEDIKIPFPQRELTGRAETGGFRVRDSAPGVDTPGELGPSAED